MSKGGRDFAVACVDNLDGIVPERITSKLVIQTPPVDLVDLYLYEIAKAYSVDWMPESMRNAAEKGPEGSVPEPVGEQNVLGEAQPVRTILDRLRPELSRLISVG